MCIYIYIYIHLSLSLSLYVYIYIHTHIYFYIPIPIPLRALVSRSCGNPGVARQPLEPKWLWPRPGGMMRPLRALAYPHAP